MPELILDHTVFGGRGGGWGNTATAAADADADEASLLEFMTEVIGFHNDRVEPRVLVVVVVEGLLLGGSTTIISDGDPPRGTGPWGTKLTVPPVWS